MENKYKIELRIILADGGKSVKDVIEMYSIRVCDDIDQMAWNLCNCDDQVQSVF